jgi:hypothetical protein
VETVYSVNLNCQNNYNILPRKSAKLNNSAPASNSASNSLPHVSFGSSLRTELSTNEEKGKYNELVKLVDKPVRKMLNEMLKKGLLLNSNSSDRSTVLDNLHKIAMTPRAQGLSNRNILYETIETLSNPYIITQQFGNIPESYQKKAVDAYLKKGETNLLRQKLNSNFADRNLAAQEINVTHSGTCVAASEEFNLAVKQPAEFARFAEGLSSPNLSVEKTIKYSNLADNILDAVWLLNVFEIPYEASDFESVKLKLAPDKNALLRAQIQTVDRDLYNPDAPGKAEPHRAPFERSSVDVLMQSTFMQAGSQQTYDSLSDKRAGKFKQDDKGLIEFEKTFVESIAEDKNKISVTYQTLDENGKLLGYETDFATIKKQITDALKMDENVIIGYTQVDQNNIVINGHEITVVRTRTDRNGKTVFICNDTDDDLARPVEYSEDYLLPKIHHAALPKAIAEASVHIQENWIEGFRTYKELKAGQRLQNAA